MADEMNAASPRLMTSTVHPIDKDALDTRLHRMVYDDPYGRCIRDDPFIRDGSITGGREKAERAAEAAIPLMGGTAQATKASR